MRARTYGLDRDTISYANRIKVGSGTVLSNSSIKQINKFVVGIKRMGLWNSMICWPMRSIHNAGTGSTVYSLGGLGVYNGTMVNSPSWGANGVSFLASPSQNAITIQKTVTPLEYSLMMVFSSDINGSAIIQAWNSTGGGLNGPNSGSSNVNGGYFYIASYRASGHTAGTAMTISGKQTRMANMTHTASLITNSTYQSVDSTIATSNITTGSGNFVSNAELRFGGRPAATGNGSGTMAFSALFSIDIRNVDMTLKRMVRTYFGGGINLDPV